MMRKFLMWWSASLPVREIKHKGQRYLERYYIGTLFGFWRVYLHRFVGSDPDGLHVHPWRWGATFILVGWYHELRRWGLRTVRWFSIVNGDTAHRVILPAGAETWTLFIHSERVMNWGFLRTRTYIEFGQPTQKVTIYQEVGEDNPTPLGDWWRKAPKGRDLRRAA